MREPSFDFSYSLGYLTTVSARLFSATLNRRLADAGLDLTSEQWAMLRVLLNEDGRNQEALLKITRHEKSSLSRILGGMEKRGLVRREKSRSDGRRKHVFITEKGAAQGAAGTRMALDVLAAIYRGIEEKDLDICRSVLARLQEGLLRIQREEEA
ncbi:MAG: MarR family transcriptional regulator [Deltaproteobacteria bacterium]|jgi:DNA-binding MarR family transcriptional regulator|nr:MarR family transcriptional regulator [Deltaproteobacteria bacterium]